MWLVIAQVGAIRAIRAISRDFSAFIPVKPTPVLVGDHIAVALAVSLFKIIDTPVEIGLAASPSVNVLERARRAISLAPGEAEGSIACSVESPIAGQITFSEVGVDIGGHAGSFTESVTFDADTHCLVEPPALKGIHVGRDGKLVGTTFGDHSSDRTGPGLVSRETRQYLLNGTLSQIG